MSLIYSDGYFRTGSNFLRNSLQLAYPEATVTSEDPVPHYGIGLVKDLTVYSGIAISVRDPLQTLSSVFSFFRAQNDASQKLYHIKALKGYLTDLQVNKDSVFVVKFGDMTTDINLTINSFAQKFPELGTPTLIDVNDINQSVIDSGAIHAVSGYNAALRVEEQEDILTNYAEELTELNSIYNEIVRS